jgi:hypothetical protein
MAASTKYIGGHGVEYTSTCNGKTYLSADWHRPATAPSGKSSWSISRDEEFNVFNEADGLNLGDPSGYWGWIGHKMEVLGNDDERIARFRTPPAGTHYWHGFPFEITAQLKPPSQLVDAWENAGSIDWALAAKLRLGKL